MSRDALPYGQTNTAAAASSQSVVWSSFNLNAASCFCRGLRFWGILERHCNSFMVSIPSSITRCDGRDRPVEEDGGRQTGRGSPPPPHLPVFSELFWRGIPLCTNFTATAASAGRPPKFVLLPRVLEALIWLYYGWICSR